MAAALSLVQRFARLLETAAGQAAARTAVARAETVLKLSISQGKARGRGQSSKAKGRTAVCLVRDRLAEVLGIPVDGMVVKATSMPGVDLYIAPEHRARFPFEIEVKSVEALNVWAALAQAAVNAGEGRPVVFFKRARSPLYAALLADDFLATVRGSDPAVQ